MNLNVPEQQVDVWAGHDEHARWNCPECGTDAPLYDHADERVWRHLDSCQFRTLLHARPPRVQCPTHGVRQVRLPWAEGRSRFTTLFERLAIDVLRECDIAGACGILRISWDEAWHLVERAVGRGLKRKTRRLPARRGVDEKAVAKGQVYMTLECELLDRRRFVTRAEAEIAVFDYLEGWYNPRRRHSALDYLSPMAYERRELVQA